MTQCEWIVQYIKRHGSITQMEAYQRGGIFRLASRIHNLKQDGYDILSVREEMGDRCYHRYSIISYPHNSVKDLKAG